MRKSITFIVLLIGAFTLSSNAKNRVIILTDISPPSQEPDDMQSMVRLLLYSNELDIEGLISTSSCWRKNDPLRTDLIIKIVGAYREVRSNLLQHDSTYPTAEQLTSVIHEGNGNGMAATGSGKYTPGSDHIISVLEKDDSRPVWICIWGGAATLAQSLKKMKKNRSADDVQLLLKMIRVYDLSGQDDAGAWICHEFPDIFYIRSQYQWRGFSYRLDNQWNDSRGGDESLVSPEWFDGNIRKNHGTLGAVYPPGTYLHEGDTPTFLNLLDNGLSDDPDSIGFGGWGGRFTTRRQKNVSTGSDNSSVIESSYEDFYMFTDATDTWQDNKTNYTNIYCPLFRWRTAVQNDFAARMDWCTKSYVDANHHPVVAVNGDTGTATLRIASAGDRIAIDASESFDPDGDSLVFSWYLYPEAGTYNGTVTITNEHSAILYVQVPDDIAPESFHIICEVRDTGPPALYRYKRIIVSGKQGTPVFNIPVKRVTPQSASSEWYAINGRRVRNEKRPGTMLLIEKNGLNRIVSFAGTSLPEYCN